MSTILALGPAISFGFWFLLLVVSAALLALLYQRETGEVFARLVGDDDDEALVDQAIAEVGAELAARYQARAERAKRAAEVARLEAISTRAMYAAAWEAPDWETLAVERLRGLTLPSLARLGIDEFQAFEIGVCEPQSRKDVERILGPDVGPRILALL